MVRITRLDGRRTELPLEGHLRDAELLFDEAAQLVQTEWQQRRRQRQQRSGPDTKRDMRWLKVTCYSLISEMLQLDQAELFDRRIRKHGRYPRGARGAPNAFQTGLMALFADDPSALNARDRERIGKLLWYAYRHYVRAEFLVGFLLQREVKGPEQKFDHSELDPAFEDWIIESRAAEREETDRGDYPKRIVEAVEARQDQLTREKAESNWDDDEE